jgi:hypothetical protein
MFSKLNSCLEPVNHYVISTMYYACDGHTIWFLYAVLNLLKQDNGSMCVTDQCLRLQADQCVCVTVYVRFQGAVMKQPVCNLMHHYCKLYFVASFSPSSQFYDQVLSHVQVLSPVLIPVQTLMCVQAEVTSLCDIHILCVFRLISHLTKVQSPRPLLLLLTDQVLHTGCNVSCNEVPDQVVYSGVGYSGDQVGYSGDQVQFAVPGSENISAKEAICFYKCSCCSQLECCQVSTIPV